MLQDVSTPVDDFDEKSHCSSDEEPKVTKDSKTYDNVHIEEHQVGIWRIFIAHTRITSWVAWIQELQETLPFIYRLFMDIYSLDPQLVLFVICLKIWSAIEEAVLMYLAGDIMRLIEEGITEGSPQAYKICKALATRAFLTAVPAYLERWTSTWERRLKTKVVNHFEVMLMQADLRLDVETSLSEASKINYTADAAWDALDEVIQYTSTILSAFSQMTVIGTVARAAGTPWFILACVAEPVIAAWFGGSRNWWQSTCFAYASNKDYRRANTMMNFSRGTYREDIIGNNLSNWIITQFKQARENLGDMYTGYPFTRLDEATTSPLSNALSRLLYEIPMIYCALKVIFTKTPFPLATLASLQSNSAALSYTLSRVLNNSQQFRNKFASVKGLYKAAEIKNTVVDGAVAYTPKISEKGESDGMGFELRDLSFAYPGSQKTSPSLSSINLSIKPGCLIVIVGSNGSGKSTLIRLLTRLYNPTSGELLIDDTPASSYKLADLRQAMVIFSQDSMLYPLSLRENIGLGWIDALEDDAMVRDSAAKGGAAGFIEKLEKKYNTVLDSDVESHQMNLHGQEGHPLNEMMDKLEKRIDISGGELQRVIASRAFMKMNSNKVKFVAVDEPSSALDAEGELHLFQQLLAAREGKTMIFVTHRFGHLTKHADVILCMKDASIVEQGTHADLMAKDGEYAKLYKIQASAFTME